MARRRILIVDDDISLLGLLATLLEEAGCEVESIAGADGFTPQLMTLGKPALVLLNPVLQNFPSKVIQSVIGEFKRTSRRPVLLFGDMSEEQLASHALKLGADGYVPVRTLLRDPLSMVMNAAQIPAAEPPPPAGPTIRELDPTAILDIDLGPLEPRPPVKPPSTRVPAPSLASPVRTELAGQILSAIEQEISAIGMVEGVEHYDVALDVMGEANLYLDQMGMVAGVFVPSAVSPDEGTTVDLAVTFPWGGVLNMEGMVEWTRAASALGRRMRSGFGVRFPDLPVDQQALLQRFLKLRTPMQIAVSSAKR